MCRHTCCSDALANLRPDIDSPELIRTDFKWDTGINRIKSDVIIRLSVTEQCDREGFIPRDTSGIDLLDPLYGPEQNGFKPLDSSLALQKRHSGRSPGR